jgi:rSAM/selenodomain-associated transferase 1
MASIRRSGPPRRGGRALAVIAKEPVAGQVKTRLAPAFGDRGAATLAAAMLADTIAAVRRVPAEPWLCYAPAEAGDRMARLAPGFRLLPQAGGDLGDRLAACMAALLATGASRALIVGADTPHVPAERYEAAFDLLDDADVVLGPAEDGGYYLIAATVPDPELFVGVPMGTGEVLRVTLERAAGRARRVHLLATMRDLDRPADLHAAVASGELAACPQTRSAVHAALGAGPAARFGGRHGVMEPLLEPRR